jgi:Zn-dependent protease with chaperone function
LGLYPGEPRADATHGPVCTPRHSPSQFLITLHNRWRTILLSPEEEDEIATSLANGGWYAAVREIISQEGAASIIPASDWRYRWVESVLRQLEGTIALIQHEPHRDFWPDDPTAPFPPPADFPLRGRPRASEYLHHLCESMVSKSKPPPPPGALGAPYSLMLVDDPASCNAFSYGFGPDGAGGIVVYSGFLDEILARAPAEAPEEPPATQPTSWLSALFGGFGAPTPQRTRPPVSAEQTGELATLLAHELAHLVLAHHLEMLSSGTIVVPGFLSLVTDFVRVLLFPVTMIFGPFVNDALANVGKASTRDFTRMHETCTSTYQEIEADVVSMRLLAYAGFDARAAVRFWERRIRAHAGAECRAEPAPPPGSASALTKKITGDSHPVAETRILRLREELERWEEQRRERLDQLRARAASDGQ